MIIKMFNIWYFVFLILSFSVFFVLYFLLKNQSDTIKKIVLFIILIFALALHFLKCFIPPYSSNLNRLYTDVWFINICAANILIFPFVFIFKNSIWKDYMFYIGTISGIISIIYPLEPIRNLNQEKEFLDVMRFYIHHSILWIVPMLMVILKLHTLNYKRVFMVPICLLIVLAFIMFNQILQSELGFVALRGDNIFEITYKNTSYIWGPDDEIGYLIAKLCPDVFKTIPVGEYKGMIKYWPWVWLIVPSFIVLTPLAFLIALPFDYKNFKNDIIKIKGGLKNVFS